MLTARLAGASRYLRITGYFRSSLPEVVGEALETVGEIRVVSDGDLYPHDVKVARDSNLPPSSRFSRRSNSVSSCASSGG
ncbi:MAG TPA: hypothetical protein VGM42_05985 [Rhodopila sp.]